MFVGGEVTHTVSSRPPRSTSSRWSSSISRSQDRSAPRLPHRCSSSFPPLRTRRHRDTCAVIEHRRPPNECASHPARTRSTVTTLRFPGLGRRSVPNEVDGRKGALLHRCVMRLDRMISDDPRGRGSSETCSMVIRGLLRRGECSSAKAAPWDAGSLRRFSRSPYSPSWERSFPRESTNLGAWIIPSRSREAFELRSPDGFSDDKLTFSVSKQSIGRGEQLL